MGDVIVFPLKMLGYSLNSVDQKELEEARQVLLDLAPHILALDSDKYGDKLASEEATVGLGWTGPLFQVLATEETKDAGYVVPSEGSLFWLDTWVMLADAPHPNTSYAWLDFIHRPEVQAKETNYNGYGRPATRRRSSSTRQSLRTPPSSRPTTSSRSSRAPRTRRATTSVSTSGRSSSRRSAADGRLIRADGSR